MSVETGAVTAITTVEQTTRQQIVIKKSRFIASVAPVIAPSEAMHFVRQVSGQYADATHNVYAWITSDDQVQQKFSDDGEPAGTAGRPVLEVIRKAGLMNVVVVVTRYFGGVMLGAGGLVRAYSEAAQVGLEAAGRRVLLPYREVWVQCHYDQHNQVRYCAKEVDAQLGDIQYLEQVGIQIFVPLEAEAKFSAMLQEVSQVRIEQKRVVLRTENQEEK